MRIFGPRGTAYARTVRRVCLVLATAICLSWNGNTRAAEGKRFAGQTVTVAVGRSAPPGRSTTLRPTSSWHPSSPSLP